MQIIFVLSNVLVDLIIFFVLEVRNAASSFFAAGDSVEWALWGTSSNKKYL